jgi:hypothetical protein
MKLKQKNLKKKIYSYEQEIKLLKYFNSMLETNILTNGFKFNHQYNSNDIKKSIKTYKNILNITQLPKDICNIIYQYTKPNVWQDILKFVIHIFEKL